MPYYHPSVLNKLGIREADIGRIRDALMEDAAKEIEDVVARCVDD